MLLSALQMSAVDSRTHITSGPEDSDSSKLRRGIFEDDSEGEEEWPAITVCPAPMTGSTLLGQIADLEQMRCQAQRRWSEWISCWLWGAPPNLQWALWTC